MVPMDLPAARDLLSRLSARAPRQAAETLLEFLKTDHAARLAALFTPDGDEDGLVLFGCTWFEQAAQDWVHRAWRKRRAQLRRGIEIQDGDHALVPIMRANALAGLLYLETPQINMETVLDVSDPLAEALLRATCSAAQHPIDQYLGSTPQDEIERRKLLLLLDRYEWRISQVARVLKVQRQTVYRRLEKLNIPLQRPERT
jgi:hypothetical protein